MGGLNHNVLLSPSFFCTFSTRRERKQGQVCVNGRCTKERAAPLTRGHLEGLAHLNWWVVIRARDNGRRLFFLSAELHHDGGAIKGLTFSYSVVLSSLVRPKVKWFMMSIRSQADMQTVIGRKIQGLANSGDTHFFVRVHSLFILYATNSQDCNPFSLHFALNDSSKNYVLVLRTHRPEERICLAKIYVIKDNN